MSETRTLGRHNAAGQMKVGPSVVPQWAINAMRPGIRLLSRMCWGIEHWGTENIPASGGLIIASNHQTYIDPFWLSLPIKRPVRYLAWSEAFQWPLIGKSMTLLGAWPLQVEGSDPAAIRRTIQWLRQGGAVVIFPEGGRCEPNGEIGRFKGGAIRLALEADVPILPVTIRGGNRVWPRGWRFPHLAKIDIIYHPLQQMKQQAGEESRACARRESGRLAQMIRAPLVEPQNSA